MGKRIFSHTINVLWGFESKITNLPVKIIFFGLEPLIKF